MRRPLFVVRLARTYSSNQRGNYSGMKFITNREFLFDTDSIYILITFPLYSLRMIDIGLKQCFTTVL